MEETIIKWSSKKIVLSFVLYLLELALLLWIISFFLTYPEEAPAGLVAIILFIAFLIIIVGFILYQRLRLLFPIKSIWNVRLKDFTINHFRRKTGSFIPGDKLKTLLSRELKGVDIQGIFIWLRFIFMTKIFWKVLLYGDVYEVGLLARRTLTLWKFQSIY